MSPSSAEPGGTAAGPSGETLKASAPTPQSPVNGAQPDEVVLTAGKSSGAFDQGLAGSYSYEFQILNASNSVVCSQTMSGGSGSSVTWAASNCNLELDAAHTWRVRATIRNGASGQMATGPWSAAASFKSPVGGYVRGNEIFDPLYNGRTVGNPIGATFVANQGLRLNGHDSRVHYELPQTLEAGEFSVMVTGFSEDSPGDKTKIMSMMEGGGDITTNDYRFTFEKRGINYPTPGAVTFRMIVGEGEEEHSINDGGRFGVSFTDEQWYFWKVTWSPGFVAGEVRENGPTGRVIYSQSRSTNGHPYRPLPHNVFLGAPVGRAGPADASIPGAVYKNVWVSSRPRPAFPNE